MCLIHCVLFPTILYATLYVILNCTVKLKYHESSVKYVQVPNALIKVCKFKQNASRLTRKCQWFKKL